MIRSPHRAEGTMRPKKPERTGEGDLFRARLDQILNLKHELVQLAGKINWDWIDREIAVPIFLPAETAVRAKAHAIFFLVRRVEAR
jgi:hypothetical protein